jgi:hypothetical protein
MISGDIQCAYCGLKGKIEGFASGSDDREANIFKHRGHNPISGHLHYQCPACSIVLLVLPMDILEGRFVNGFSGLPVTGDSVRAMVSGAVYKLSELWKTIQARLFPRSAELAERRG